MIQDRRRIIHNTCKHVPAYGKSRSGAMRDSVCTDHRKAFLARCPQWANVPLSYFFGELKPSLLASVCDKGVGAPWNSRSER